MVFNGTNSLGWAQLVDGNLTNAVVILYDDKTALSGLFVVLLYFAFQIVLYAKTRNATLGFTVGLFFTIFVTQVQHEYTLNAFSMTFVILSLAFLSASMIYSWAIK